MSKKPDLRVGIVSDVHVGFTLHYDPRYYGLGQPGSQEKWLAYTLQCLKAKGVDAVMVVGDFCNACDYTGKGRHKEVSEGELRRFGEIFREVFAGTDTRLIGVYGNHDSGLLAEEPACGGHRSHWQEAFGEPFSRVMCYEINGYLFVGAHWGLEAEAGPVVAEKAAAANGKPVFYLQHGAFQGTTPDGDPAYLFETNEQGVNNVRAWENVVAFSGHTHFPITDERAIWQSAEEGQPRCTVVSCSTLNYGCVADGSLSGENLQTKHALYMTVTDREVCFERLSFWTEEMLALASGEKTEPDIARCMRSAGPDWRFTVGGEKIFDPTCRAQEAVAPVFPEGAMVGADCGDTYATVKFPAACPLERPGDFVHSYRAEAVDAAGRVVSAATICTEHHVDGDERRFSSEYRVAVGGLTPDTPYTFRVYARDCWQKSGKPLTSFVCRTKK